jgi:predicted unusual protein kinase regulating ubiquinone biosynthesis (AarF/ABC1/UbiB family)
VSTLGARRRLAGTPAGVSTAAAAVAVAGGVAVAIAKGRVPAVERTVVRARRASRLGFLAARRAVRYQFVRRRGPDDLDEFHLRTAEEVVAALGSMKGVAMKVGQIASVLATGLPEAYGANLARLQQHAPPMSFALVDRVVREDLGRPPELVFERFDRHPAAAASIGQVHRAALPDGSPVAVKVQYPGLEATIQADLDNVAVLYNLVRMVAPGVDPDQMVGELRDRMIEELDYELEARRQEHFRLGWLDHPWVRIPRVHPAFSGRRVLTSEWVTGERLDAVCARPQADRDRAGEQLFRFWAGSLFRLGQFNGDPHPGNYFFDVDRSGPGPDGDPVIWFLDFGLVKEFSPLHVAQLAEQVDVLRTRDPHALVDAMHRFGWLRQPERISPAMALEYAGLVFRPLVERDFRYTPEYMVEVVQGTFSVDGPYGELVRHLTVPRDHLILNRIVLGLGSLLARLGAAAPWSEIFDEYQHGRPPATPLGERDRAWFVARAS